MRGMDAKVLEEGLMALAWEEAKPEEKVVSVFDVSEAFDKFIKRVESMTKDAEVTTRNREMLDYLQSASAQYHEAKAMNSRVSLSAE